MKNIFIYLSCFLLLNIDILADNKDLFIQENANFHTIDIEELKGSKTDGKCFNCHLFDKKLDSLSKWLTPQTSLDAEIKNLNTNNGDPDQFSRACLMCHDGSEASLVINAPISPCGIRQNVSVIMGAENHPVFIDYSHKKDLHDVSFTLKGEWQDANIVEDILRDNKVVCVSCHVPHRKKGKNHLRTSTKKSKLCLGCHNK